MSQPSRLPRKYLATLQDSIGVLKLIATKARNRINDLQEKHKECNSHSIIELLSGIEAEAYRIALELSELEVAGSCDQCPSAPVVTEAHVRLELLTTQLKQLSDFARASTEQELIAEGNS